MGTIPIQNKYFIYFLRKLFKKYLTNYIVVDIVSEWLRR